MCGARFFYDVWNIFAVFRLLFCCCVIFNFLMLRMNVDLIILWFRVVQSFCAEETGFYKVAAVLVTFTRKRDKRITNIWFISTA